jgi:hypothetical protein
MFFFKPDKYQYTLNFKLVQIIAIIFKCIIRA